MKLDQYYSGVYVCPTTQSVLSQTQINYSNGVCPHCGTYSGSTFTHTEIITGKYLRPSLIERLQGARTKFFPKDTPSVELDIS